MRLPISFHILYRAGLQWVENKDSRLGAALAYYTLFSIAPLLILAIKLAGILYGEEAARGQVAHHLTEFTGKETAELVQALIEYASKPDTGIWPTIMGLTILVVGALGLFLHVRAALCTIWKLEPPPGHGWFHFFLDYLLALIMVPLTGCLLIFSLVLSTTMPLIEDFLEKNVGQLPWHRIEMGVSLLMLTLFFAVIYFILSGRRIAVRFVWYGAAITALLFTLGKTLIGMYLAYSSTVDAFGAAGSLVAFLIWVYFSAQIVFFGAELIQARRTKHEWWNVKPV